MPLLLQGGTPSTALWGGALGLVFAGLGTSVVRSRFRTGALEGDGGDKLLSRQIRGHANFCESVPVILVLMSTAEGNSFAPAPVFHALGATLLVARAAHAYAFQQVEEKKSLRAAGTILTLTVAVITSGLCIWGGLRNL